MHVIWLAVDNVVAAILYLVLMLFRPLKLTNATSSFPFPTLYCISWQHSSHYSSLFSCLPFYFSLWMSKNPTRNMNLHSVSPPALLPFCTCILALFPSSIHSCLSGNYHLHSSSPLISLFSCSSLPSSIPSRSHIHSHFPLYFLSLSSSVHVLCVVHVENNPLCCSFPFHLFLLSSLHFSPHTHEPTEPHPTPCLLRALCRH